MAPSTPVTKGTEAGQTRRSEGTWISREAFRFTASSICGKCHVLPVVQLETPLQQKRSWRERQGCPAPSDTGQSWGAPRHRILGHSRGNDRDRLVEGCKTLLTHVFMLHPANSRAASPIAAATNSHKLSGLTRTHFYSTFPEMSDMGAFRLKLRC